MKKYLISVNGKSFEVEVEELKASQVATPAVKIESAPEPVATPTPPVSHGEDVTAPMPGSIHKILVNTGDRVNAGDVLLILEAMKMENEIVSPIDGSVLKIARSEGSNVNTSDLLIVIG